MHHLFRLLISFFTRLKEDEGGVPSTVAEAHRKQLEDMDDVVRKEQQVRRASRWRWCFA